VPCTLNLKRNLISNAKQCLRDSKEKTASAPVQSPSWTNRVGETDGSIDTDTKREPREEKV